MDSSINNTANTNTTSTTSIQSTIENIENLIKEKELFQMKLQEKDQTIEIMKIKTKEFITKMKYENDNKINELNKQYLEKENKYKDEIVLLMNNYDNINQKLQEQLKVNEQQNISLSEQNIELLQKYNDLSNILVKVC